MISARDFAQRLSGLAKAVRKEEAQVHERVRPQYQDALRTLSRTYLLAEERPNGIEEVDWEAMVNLFVQRIEVVARSDGLRVQLAGRDVLGAQGQVIADGAETYITYFDITAWIQAGQENEPLGKNLENASDADLLVTAQRIYTAIHGGKRKDGGRNAPDPKHAGLRQAILAFLNRADEPVGFQRYYPTLLAIWSGILKKRYLSDMGAVKKRVKSVLQGV